MLVGKRLKYTENGFICSKCELELPVERIACNRTFCKACKILEFNEQCNRDIESFLRRVCTVKRYECKKSGRDFDLTKEFLVDLWNSQNGLCYYTDQPMTWGYGNDYLPSALSVDQVVPSKGYTQNNVVLCQAIVNKIKRDYTYIDLENLNPAEWSKRIKKIHFLNHRVSNVYNI